MKGAKSYGATEESVVKVPGENGGEKEIKIPAYPGRWPSADDLVNGVITSIKHVH